MEWVVLFAGISGLIGVPVYFRFRKKSERITPSLQAELDQTPEWWDNEFRKLQGLPALPFIESDIERWKRHGIQDIWDGDVHYSFKHLTDISPPTTAEIWAPSPDDSYDLSVDLAAMASAIQKSQEGKDE